MTRPTFGDLLDQVGKQNAGKQRGPIPAEIVTYDRATQTCSAKPLVHASGGADLPEVPAIPVLFPRGAGVSLTWDLAAGDVVFLIPAEIDISKWHARGIAGEAPTKRRLNLIDAVAIPAIGAKTSPLAANAYAAGALVLAGADVRLGDSTASDFVSLASLVDGNFNSLTAVLAAIDTQLKALAQPGITPPSWTATGATKVKAK